MNTRLIGVILAAGSLGGLAAIEPAAASTTVVTAPVTASGGAAELSITFGRETAGTVIVMNIYYPGVNGDTGTTYEGRLDLALNRTSSTRTETVYEGRATAAIVATAGSTGTADTYLRVAVASNGNVVITMDVTASAEGTTTPLSATTVTSTDRAGNVSGEFVELVNG
jgi:hypothetical protein